MKKILFVVALGAFAACGGSNTEATVDSTAVQAPVVDTTVAPVADSTTAPVVVDTAAHQAK